MNRRQLLAAGICSSAIGRLVDRRALLPIHVAVYAVGHLAPIELGPETAALLAVRDGAVLSHISAAILWELWPASAGDGFVHVLLEGGPAGRRRGVRVHRTHRLDAKDIRVRHGLPVTSPPRALLDNAPLVTERQLELAFDRALVAGIMRLGDVSQLLARTCRCAGAPLLASLLARQSGPAITRSEAEERLLALIRGAQLPHPRVSERLHGYEVDFYWPVERLVVEVDGFRFHSGHRAFEQDRRKDATLQTAGLSTMRVTWRQIEEEPYAVVARIAQALTVARAQSA